MLFDQGPQLLFQESPQEGQWEPPKEFPNLSAVSHFALDTETTGKNPLVDMPVGISLTWQSDQRHSMYFPFGHSSGNLDPDQVRFYMVDTLMGKSIVGAHTKFDVHVCKNWGLDLEALGVETRDVAFNGALLDDDPNVKLDLDTLGMKYCGFGKQPFPYDKNKMKELPSWLVGPYAEGDTHVTYAVEEKTLPFIRTENLERVWALENSIVYAVCEIERNGCRIDTEKLYRWQGEIRVAYQQTILDLFNMTGMKVDPDSGVSMASLLAHLNIEPPTWMAKGNRRKKPTGKNVRKYTEEELLSLNHPVFNKVVESRWLSSLLSKFYDKYAVGLGLGEGDIIRSQFHQLKAATDDEDDDEKERGTVSGRFSSAGGKDLRSGFSFNAQQVIKSKLQRDTLGDRWIVRELFTPDDDFEYFSADLSQIEYRIATHFANAEKIIKAYQDPSADFHASNGALIQRYKPDFTDRTKIKNAGFAFVFGSGDETFAATAGISKSEANEVLGILHRDIPEFSALLTNLKNQAEARGFVQTLYGRRARFGTHEKRYYAALNRVVQGSAADIFKVYLKGVYDERKTLGIHKLRQVVHDEMNGDKERGEVYTNRMREFMNTQRIQLRVPIIWDLKTGANWKECH